MTAVPLILDRVRKGIVDKINLNPPIRVALVTYCLNYKRRWTTRGWRTPIVDKIVVGKVAAAMGGKMRAMISGKFI
jgi:long-chain acyl-CoA synthetase